MVIFEVIPANDTIFKITKNVYLVADCLKNQRVFFPESTTNPNIDIFVRAHITIFTLYSNLNSHEIIIDLLKH